MFIQEMENSLFPKHKTLPPYGWVGLRNILSPICNSVQFIYERVLFLPFDRRKVQNCCAKTNQIDLLFAICSYNNKP